MPNLAAVSPYLLAMIVPQSIMATSTNKMATVNQSEPTVFSRRRQGAGAGETDILRRVETVSADKRDIGGANGRGRRYLVILSDLDSRG